MAKLIYPKIEDMEYVKKHLEKNGVDYIWNKIASAYCTFFLRTLKISGKFPYNIRKKTLIFKNGNHSSWTKEREVTISKLLDINSKTIKR